MTQLSIIVAMAKNRTIGVNNTLPWRCPADLKHFKALTMGHHMIMGRKTFDSIGKALPGRTTVVITRDRALKMPDCIVTHSLKAAIDCCTQDSEAFIVGGAEIYRQAIDIVQTMHITEIQQNVLGDAVFPEFNRTEWRETTREIQHQTEPQSLEYHFVTYQREQNIR